MKKEPIKSIELPYHCFEAGDLVRNQDKELFVITEIKEGQYSFMNLQDKTIKIVGDILHIRKGSISKQACSVFDKYNYLYQPSKND